jgi:SAM-dependent methyltransferase
VIGFGGEYRRLVAWRKLAFGGKPEAYETAVGGNFASIGPALAAAVAEFGLKDGDSLVDVGCGAGRLAAQLKTWPRLRYAGFDVVADLLDHARAVTQRPDWRFELLSEPVLPIADASADMCCFFSVFTHLRPPTIAAYLAESRRVLKPGGKVVCSFLDPAVDQHRRYAQPNPLKWLAARLIYPLNIGFSPDEMRGFATAAGLSVIQIESPHAIGQSLAVFARPA